MTTRSLSPRGEARQRLVSLDRTLRHLEDALAAGHREANLAVGLIDLRRQLMLLCRTLNIDIPQEDDRATD